MSVDSLVMLYQQLKDRADEINTVPLEELGAVLKSFNDTYSQFEATLADTKVEIFDGDNLLQDKELHPEATRND